MVRLWRGVGEWKELRNGRLVFFLYIFEMGERFVFLRRRSGSSGGCKTWG